MDNQDEREDLIQQIKKARADIKAWMARLNQLGDSELKVCECAWCVCGDCCVCRGLLINQTRIVAERTPIEELEFKSKQLCRMCEKRVGLFDGLCKACLMMDSGWRVKEDK